VGQDAAADAPRTSNNDDTTKDPAATEVDKDMSTVGAFTKNNVPDKAATTDISNTTPSKEDSVVDPSTNMPLSIIVSGKIVAITNLPAIASPSAGASITLTNQKNSHHRLPGDKIVSIYM
jgi:hypothetical protein